MNKSLPLWTQWVLTLTLEVPWCVEILCAQRTNRSKCDTDEDRHCELLFMQVSNEHSFVPFAMKSSSKVPNSVRFFCETICFVLRATFAFSQKFIWFLWQILDFPSDAWLKSTLDTNLNPWGGLRTVLVNPDACWFPSWATKRCHWSH